MITVRNLDKSFGATHAVRDLSFDVRPGVVTGFLGPNGAGKSTTLRLMLGLDRGGGETLFDGRRFRSLQRPAREVGVVLDATSFHPARRAHDHLRMVAAANDLPAAGIDDALATVGLSEVARHRPKAFSQGMAQRLALAVALLGDPRVLILDEPANGLDPQGIQWLRRFLRHFAGRGRTVLVSSHLLAEMSLMAEDLVVIGRGRLISAGPVADFVERFTRRQVLVRSPVASVLTGLLAAHATSVTPERDGALLVSGLSAAAIGDLAAANGVALHELTVRSASLEQAFLEATGSATEFDGPR